MDKTCDNRHGGTGCGQQSDHAPGHRSSRIRVLHTWYGRMPTAAWPISGPPVEHDSFWVTVNVTAPAQSPAGPGTAPGTP
jgi:hypothetical protein